MNQLWRGYLSQLDSDITEQLVPMLGPQEAEKYQRLNREQRKNEFVLSRALMRMALSQHYSKPLTYWRFSQAPNAAPQLLNPIDAPLFISLSHSTDCVMLAISDQAVGLDVEHVEQRKQLKKIAAKVFSPEQQAFLQSLPEKQLRKHFYQLWTHKEALVKVMAGSNPSFQMISSTNWPEHHFHIQHGNLENHHMTLASKQPNSNFTQYHAIPFSQVEVMHFLRN